MNEKEWKKIRNMQAGILIGLAAFAIIVGIVIIICGNHFQYSAGETYSSYKRTNAVVTDVRTELEEENGFLVRRYYPKMEYKVDRKEYVFEYSVGTKDSYEIGEKFVIMYNPDDPSQYVLANKEKTVMIICSVLAGIAIFFGVALLAAAIDMFRKRYVPRRKVKAKDADV